MSLLSIALAVGLQAAAPATSSAPIDSWFKRDDYPAEALVKGEQGTSIFSLDVGPDGAITNCWVMSSSGSRALDEATCEIALRRGHFDPARRYDVMADDLGMVLAEVRWSLEPGPTPRAADPQARERQGFGEGTLEPVAPPPRSTRLPPAPPIRALSQPARAEANLATYVRNNDYPAQALGRGEEGTTGFRLTVDQSGRATDCVVTSSSGSASIDHVTCRIMIERARFTPAIDLDGAPTEDHVSARITWSLASR